MGPDTAVISFQNGVLKDNYLRAHYDISQIMGGVGYVATTIDRPGVIRQTGPMQRLIFGEFDGHRSARGEAFLQACLKGGINAELSPECLGGDMFQAGWDEVSVALRVSAYSLKALVEAFRPLLVAAGTDGGPGASVVGLDFDATVAWPAYDWMGVSKAALESLSRYLARDLGPDKIRMNLVAAGPVKTLAAKSIPGFATFEDTWADRAPLGWDVLDTDVVARACVALFSDLLPMTTGEIIHVDGGVHATGA